MNESATVEEPNPVPQVRTTGIHVTTRRADSAIMFLEPVISVDPETHKQRNREVLGMTKSKSSAKGRKRGKADFVGQTTPQDIGDPSTTTKTSGRKKKKNAQSIEPASEQPPVKKTPRPRARPLRTKKDAAPGTMVLDPLSSTCSSSYCFLTLPSLTHQQ